MLGLLMTGAYILKGIGSIAWPTETGVERLPSMTIREHIVIWPLMLLMLSLVYGPCGLQAVINDTVTAIFN